MADFRYAMPPVPRMQQTTAIRRAVGGARLAGRVRADHDGAVMDACAQIDREVDRLRAIEDAAREVTTAWYADDRSPGELERAMMKLLKVTG